jgi:Transposase DDE domain group 1
VRQQTSPFSSLSTRPLKVEFQESRVTSDGGLILVRELDERLGFSDLIAQHIADPRGKNTQFPLADLVRQSVYRRLAGYEDVNVSCVNNSVSNECTRDVRAAPRSQTFSEPIRRNVGSWESRSASGAVDGSPLPRTPRHVARERIMDLGVVARFYRRDRVAYVPATPAHHRDRRGVPQGWTGSPSCPALSSWSELRPHRNHEGPASGRRNQTTQPSGYVSRIS